MYTELLKKKLDFKSIQCFSIFSWPDFWTSQTTYCSYNRLFQERYSTDQKEKQQQEISSFDLNVIPQGIFNLCHICIPLLLKGVYRSHSNAMQSLPHLLLCTGAKLKKGYITLLADLQKKRTQHFIKNISLLSYFSKKKYVRYKKKSKKKELF